MTFKTSVETEDTGILTYEQEPVKVIFIDNHLDVTGDILVLGTVTSNNIDGITDGTSATFTRVMVTDATSSSSITIGDTNVISGVISTSSVSADSVSSSGKLATPTVTISASSDVTTNGLSVGILRSNSLTSNAFDVDSFGNMSGLTDVSASSILTHGSLKVGFSHINSSNIKTKDITSDSVVALDAPRLRTFKNLTSSKNINVTRLKSNNFVVHSGKINAYGITLDTLSGQNLSVFTDVPNVRTLSLTAVDGVTSNRFNVDYISGPLVTISSTNNISNTGYLTTKSLNTVSIKSGKFSKHFGSLYIDNIRSINKVLLTPDTIKFGSMNPIASFSGSTPNVSAINSSISASSISITNGITIHNLAPSKIIADSINAEVINFTVVRPDLISANSLHANDINISGAIDVHAIYSSKDITIQSNVNIEGTVFANGDVHTDSLLSSKYMITPLLDGVSNITSSEHYLDESIVNGIVFDEDGIRTTGEYKAPSINTDTIVAQTFDKPITINGTTSLSGPGDTVFVDLESTGIVHTSQLVADGITSDSADITALNASSITITNPLREILKDNRIHLKTLKSSSISTQQDVFANTLVSAMNNKYIIRVHVVSDGPLALSTAPAYINGTKVMPGLIVLVNDQADSIENGIYIVVSGTLVRYRLLINSDATDAVVITPTDELFINIQNPSVIGHNPVAFVLVPSTNYQLSLEGNRIINDTTSLSSGVVNTSVPVISIGNVSTSEISASRLSLSSGFIDIPSFASVNGMTTTSDHLQNVTDIVSNKVSASDISVTNLITPSIIGTASFGGVIFDNQTLTGINSGVSVIHSNSVQTSNISTYDISNSVISGNIVSSGSIVTGEVNTPELNISSVSVTAPEGAYTFKFPDIYYTNAKKTALMRTGNGSDNEWSVIPNVQSVGTYGSIQYNSDTRLKSTSDFIIKATATLKINISSVSATLTNTDFEFVDGVYPYNDNVVSFDISVVSGVPTLTDATVVNSNIYDIQMEIPITHSIIQVNRSKVNDLLFSGNNIESMLNDLVVETSTPLTLTSDLVNGISRIGFNSNFNAITDGTVIISSDGTFVGASEPTDSEHPVTKNYTDTHLQTFKWTESADYVHNQSISNYSNGVITPVNVSSIDGVQISNISDGTKILLVNQISKIENGLYVLSNGKTTLTRILTGNVAGTSTHIISGHTNTDAVYVCTGTDITAGTDPCVYTKIIDGKYTYGTGIINNGEVNLNTSTLNISTGKVTSAASIPHNKLSNTGIGVKSLGVISQTAVLGSITPTIVDVSPYKSKLYAHEEYTATKSFDTIVSATINTDSVHTTGVVISGDIPFVTNGTDVNMHSINDISVFDKFYTDNVYKHNISQISELSSEYSLLTNQDDPSENGFYNYNVKANIPTPYLVNDSIKVNDNGIQNIGDVAVSSNTANTVTLDASTVRTDVIRSGDRSVDVNGVSLSSRNISADTLHTSSITFKKPVFTDVTDITYENIAPLSGSNVYTPETVLLVQGQDNATQNGIYVTKVGPWVKLTSKYAKMGNARYQIMDTDVLPFTEEEYDFTDVTNISKTYTVEYYSDVRLELVGTFVDGRRVRVGDKVLVKDDGIYIVSTNNWIKTNTLQGGEIVTILKGAKYADLEIKKVDQKTVYNYDHIVDHVIYSPVDILSPVIYDPGSKVLISGQTNTTENGIYTVSNTYILTAHMVLPAAQYTTILNIGNMPFTVVHSDGVNFYSKPNVSIDYYLEPEELHPFDTFTDGVSIFKYTTDSTVEKIRDIIPSDYVLVTSIQKVLHLNKFVPVISRQFQPAVSVHDTRFEYPGNIIGTKYINGPPDSDITINTGAIGSHGLTSLDFPAQNTTINSASSIIKGSLESNDINTLDAKLSKSMIIQQGDIIFDHLDIMSDISLSQNTKIFQQGTRVSAVIHATDVPVGLVEGVKHKQVVLILDTLGPYVANKYGKWVKVLTPDEPYVFQSVHYTTVGGVIIETTEPGTNKTNINTGDVTISQNVNTDSLSIGGDITVSQFASDQVDIQVQGTVSIGMKYINVHTHYANSLTISNLDPLGNAIDTSLRGYINNAQLYPGAIVLLINDGAYAVYSDRPAELIPNPEQYSFYDTTNNKYFNHMYEEIFPEDNITIESTTKDILASTYVTDTNISSSNTSPGTDNVYPLNNNVINIGSVSTTSSVSVHAESVTAKSMSVNDTIGTSNMHIHGNFTNTGDIILDGNIESGSELKFIESPITLDVVNDVTVSSGMSVNDVRTPSITHDGILNVRSISGSDIVINDTSISSTLTSQSAEIPVFNKYEFSAFNIYGEVSKIFTVAPLALSGVPTGLIDGDIVIVNEPHDNSLTNITVSIPNPTDVNVITLPAPFRVQTINIINTTVYSSIFKQIDDTTLSIYVFNVEYNLHGYRQSGKIPVDASLPIDISITGYNTPIANGVYKVKSGSWDKVIPDNDKYITSNINYYYNSVNKPIELRFPYKFQITPSLVYVNGVNDVTRLSDDTLIVDLNPGYQTGSQYTKVPQSGTFSINISNKNVRVRNVFFDKLDHTIYVSNGDNPILSKSWIKVSHVIQTQHVHLSNPVLPTYTLRDGDTILLLAQVSSRENGIYIVQNGLLIRSSQFNTHTYLDEFVWDMNEGYGYYVYGKIGNFIVSEKTDVTHPHLVDTLTMNKLHTSNVLSNVSDVKLAHSASNMLMEVMQWNCNKQVLSGKFANIISPVTNISGSLVAGTVTTPSDILPINQYIQSSAPLKLISSSNNVIINGTLISHSGWTTDNITVPIINVNSLHVGDYLSSDDGFEMSEFTVNTNALSNDGVLSVNNGINLSTALVSTNIQTEYINVEKIDSPVSITFSNNYSDVMTLYQRSLSIPKMYLSNIVSPVIGRTITSVFTDNTGTIDAFTKAREINLNTVSSISGYSSHLDINGTVNIEGNDIIINRPMKNRTKDLEVYGDIKINSISATDKLTLEGDIIISGLFSMSNKLNKVNFTTDLELGSFMDQPNIHKLSIGNRQLTNSVSLPNKGLVELRSKKINLNYLQDVPSFKWQPYVDVICEYPIDILKPVHVINGKNINVGMEILLTANGQDNAVYTVITGNFLSRIKSLDISQAYTEENVKSVYLTGSVLVNSRPYLTVASVPKFSNNWELDKYETHSTDQGIISTAPEVVVSFLLKFTSTNLYGIPTVYYNNGYRVYYHSDRESFVSSMAYNHNSVEIKIPGGVKVNEIYSVKTTFHVSKKYITMSLNGDSSNTKPFGSYRDVTTYNFAPFKDEYTIGYDLHLPPDTTYAKLRVVRMTDFTVSVPSPDTISTSKTYMIRDVIHNTNTKTLIYPKYLSENIIYTFNCNLLALENGTPTLVSCNGNRIYYNKDTGFYMNFLTSSVGNSVTSHVPTVVTTNKLYRIRAECDYHSMTISLTVNNIKGTVTSTVPSDHNTLLQPLVSETCLGDISPFTDSNKRLTAGEITNFEIYAPGYPPTVPRVHKVSDKLRIIGQYIHDTPTVHDPYSVHVDTSILDNRSKISVDPTKYNIYPVITVTSNSSFTVTPYGDTGSVMSTTDPIGYVIENFDYSRIDKVTLVSGETTKTFTFTSTKYQFDLKSEHVSFNFVGKPGLIFSGEMLDSCNTVRSPGYSNYNTWAIDVTRVDPNDTTSYEFGVEYHFVVSKYPNTPVKIISIPFPTCDITYNESTGTYVQTSFSGQDHIKDIFTTISHRPEFGSPETESIKHVVFEIKTDSILIDNAPPLQSSQPVVLADESYFKLIRIPNTLGLKSGIYNTKHPVTHEHYEPTGVLFNNLQLTTTPASPFSSINFLKSDNKYDIRIKNAGKYRIIAVINPGHPSRSDFFVYVDSSGEIVHNVPVDSVSLGFIRTSTPNPIIYGTTVNVYDDYIFIAMDKTGIASAIQVPIKNQPEYTFPNIKLNIKTTPDNSINVFSNLNTQISNVSLVRQYSGHSVYRVPNPGQYTPGLYTNYKFNKPHGVKRTYLFENIRRTMKYDSFSGMLKCTLNTNPGSYVEEISIAVLPVVSQRFIFSLQQTQQIYLYAFPEDTTVFPSDTPDIDIQFSVRMSSIELNFNVNQDGTFQFEYPENVSELVFRQPDIDSWIKPNIIIPGGNVTSVSVNNDNTFNGTVSKSGPVIYDKGTVYGIDIVRRHDQPNVNTTNVHVTSKYMYITLQSNLPQNTNMHIPIYLPSTQLPFSSTTVTTLTSGVQPVIQDTDIVLYPSDDSSPLDGHTVSGYQMALSDTVFIHDPIMELLPGSTLIKPSDPIGYKRVIRLNDDTVKNGSYSLTHDIATHSIVFVPDRKYSKSGPTNVLFRYKIEINKNKEIVVEKKPLYTGQVLLPSDNESFGLSVYLVGKHKRDTGLRMFSNNARSIINIPAKKYTTIFPSFMTSATINMGFLTNTTIVKTPIHFNNNVLVKFEQVNGVTFTCTKISSNIFLVSASTQLAPLRSQLSFKVLFLETDATIDHPSKPIRYVQSIKNGTSNSDKSLLDFVSEHTTHFLSMVTVPYPATSSTDAFNINLNPSNLSPIYNDNVFSYPVSNTHGRVIAVKTILMDEPVYTFRMHVTADSTTATLDISRYPSLSPDYHFHAEMVGPLYDNSYILKNSITYSYKVHIHEQTLHLKIDTRWSNETYWDVTVYRSVPEYSDHVNVSFFS